MPKINVPGVSFKVITTGGSAQVVYDGSMIMSDSILYYDGGIDDTVYAQGRVTTGGATSFTDVNKAGLWTTNEWSGYRVENLMNDETGAVIGNSDTVLTSTLTGAEVWDVDDNYVIQHETLLTDTTKTWTPDEWIGLKLFIPEISTDATGIISDNTATTITVSSLTGGTRNTIRTGDDYRIISPIDSGDTLEYDTLTNLGGTISMSVSGVPSISGASGTHTFNYRILDVSDGNNPSAWALVTVTV